MVREIRYGRRGRDVLGTIAAATLLLLGGGAAWAWADDPQQAKDLPEQIVDTMNAIFGKHPGYRAVHAKGIVCEGEFTPHRRPPRCRGRLTSRGSRCA